MLCPPAQESSQDIGLTTAILVCRALRDLGGWEDRPGLLGQTARRQHKPSKPGATSSPPSLKRWQLRFSGALRNTRSAAVGSIHRGSHTAATAPAGALQGLGGHT